MKRVTRGLNGVRDVNFDVLSFILGKRGDGGPIRDIVSYLMGKLVGFITEVVNDVYEELRSAPIHTSITIEGNVYPRVDNTRLGLETIKGRTVVDNDALVPCVVSGVEVTGFNQWDEVWDVGRIGSSTGQNANTGYDIRSRNYIPVFPNTLYCIANTTTVNIFFYNADEAFIGRTSPLSSGAPTFATPSNCHFMRFCTLTSQNIGYNPSVNPICVNYSKTTGTPKNGDYLPYQHTALPIPPTTLNGVGTAQDYIEAVEVGENDYKLIKTAVMYTVDLGTRTWGGSNGVFYNQIAIMKTPSDFHVAFNGICPKYSVVSLSAFVGSSPNLTMARGDVGTYEGHLVIRDTNYNSAKDFAAAMSGVYLTFELATPTETVLAEHLTLAEVSMLAENGGIIGIVNANGDIVQPDLTVTTVISKSITTN